MDKDSKLLSEAYQGVAKYGSSGLNSQMYDAIVDAYYAVDRISRHPNADPAVVLEAQRGLRDILAKLRTFIAHE
jgi:hypothetical protein